MSGLLQIAVQLQDVAGVQSLCGIRGAQEMDAKMVSDLLRCALGLKGGCHEGIRVALKQLWEMQDLHVLRIDSD